MNYKKMLIFLVSILFLTGLGLGQDSNTRGGRSIMSQLDDTQRNEVRDMVREMRDAGATREEIARAMGDKFASWGLEYPEGRYGGPSFPMRESPFVDNDGDGINDFHPHGDFDGDGILNKDDTDFRDQMNEHRESMGMRHGGMNGMDHGMGRPRGDRGGRPQGGMPGGGMPGGGMPR